MSPDGLLGIGAKIGEPGAVEGRDAVHPPGRRGASLDLAVAVRRLKTGSGQDTFRGTPIAFGPNRAGFSINSVTFAACAPFRWNLKSEISNFKCIDDRGTRNAQLSAGDRRKASELPQKFCSAHHNFHLRGTRSLSVVPIMLMVMRSLAVSVSRSSRCDLYPFMSGKRE